MAQYRHTKAELMQMQSLPLSIKIPMTKRRIKEFYDYYQGDVYLSWSGGKDSTVLKHIIEHMSGVWDVPMVFSDTGLEFPELRKFVYDEKEKNPNIVIVKPQMNFNQVVKEYGYPIVSKEVSALVHLAKTNHFHRQMRMKGLNADGTESAWNQRYKKWRFLIDAPFDISSKCCDVMKKKPFREYEKQTKRHPISRMTTQESAMRENSWLLNGCNAFDNAHPRSMPMAFWTEQDVLQYIVENNIEIPSVYGEVIKDEKTGKLKCSKLQRTGCMFCGYGRQLEKEPNRFQQMKQTHPKIWDYVINKMNFKEPLNYIGVPYDIDYQVTWEDVMK